jgi:hypothetical protein
VVVASALTDWLGVVAAFLAAILTGASLILAWRTIRADGEARRADKAAALLTEARQVAVNVRPLSGSTGEHYDLDVAVHNGTDRVIFAVNLVGTYPVDNGEATHEPERYRWPEILAGHTARKQFRLPWDPKGHGAPDVGWELHFTTEDEARWWRNAYGQVKRDTGEWD